jgi:hypothetical protein
MRRHLGLHGKTKMTGDLICYPKSRLNLQPGKSSTAATFSAAVSERVQNLVEGGSPLRLADDHAKQRGRE